MGLEIKTGSHRNFYIWSTIGMASFSASFYLIKDKEKSFETKLVSIGLSCVSMGLIGILLTLFSCFKMYFRVGIIPGIYHTTICVPSWENDKFTFSLPQEFYFACVSGILTFMFYSIVFFAYTDLSIDFFIFGLLLTYSTLIILTYSYFYRFETKHELIGNFIMLVIMHYGITQYQEFNVLTFMLGGSAIFLALGIVWTINRALKKIDCNSISIIIAVVQIVIGGAIAVYCVIARVEIQLKLVDFLPGPLFFIGVYSVAKSKLIENAFLLMFSSFCNLIFCETGTELTVCYVLIGFGYCIMVAGDLPFKYCSKCNAERPKSPLHSPLL